MNKHRFVEIDIAEEQANCWYFYQPNKNGRVKARAEYSDIFCKRCGKVNELEAMRRGGSVPVCLAAMRKDFFRSSDNVCIVSAKAKHALEEIPEVKVKFFALSVDSDYWLLYPEHLIECPTDARRYNPIQPAIEGDAFQPRGNPCPGCGRFREITWRPQWFSFSEDILFCGVNLETRMAQLLILIASQEVCAHLEAEKLTGMKFFPIIPKT